MTRTITVVIGAVAVLATAGLAALHNRAVEPRGDGQGTPQAVEDPHAAHSAAVAEITRMAAAGDVHANHALDELGWGQAQPVPSSGALPADDASAAARLASSPRKSQFVNIDVAGTPVRTWVVRPQGQAKAPVVVVIQEIFGLSDWIRAVADQLAADGFIAVAPDLLSGKGPNGGDSSSFAAAGANTMQATLKLAPAEVMARLKAVRDWGLKQPQANGKSATVGFCYGGTQSFTLATEDPTLSAAVVYYGTAPTDGPPGMPGPGPFVPSERLANIKAPVLALYADPAIDKMIGNGLEATEARMRVLGKVYERHIYEGSAHGFLRAQGGNNGANLKASQAAWPLTLAWIRKHAS